ncbi:hypothetical protein Drorol1_Dr00013993 [Drosera rotundifolia]
METRTSSAVLSPHLVFPPKTTAFPITRHSFSLRAKVIYLRGKLVESGMDGSSSLKPVSATLLIAEKEEAKAVLTLFLKQRGLSNAAAARTISKSDLFLQHLVSRLHVLHKTWYMTGRELTTMEIREALNPYFEALHCQHGDAFIHMVEHFPDQKKLPGLAIDSLRSRAMARVSESVPVEDLPPHVIYLVELGLDLEKIRAIIWRFPSFAYCSLERKVKPLVEFLIKIGVPESGIPNVLYKSPQLCWVSLSKNLIPTMRYLEDELGINQQKWPELILRRPLLFACSRRKFNSTVTFLTEMGLSKETVGKVLIRRPTIVSFSVEDKLRPTAKYLSSLGVDVTVIMQGAPAILTLSIENNLRPMTDFFLEKGYSMEEIAMMIQRFPSLYNYSLFKNVLPKWEFFLSMGYPRSELVKFSTYFGYSLEGRIKPRYARMKLCGVRLSLNRLLSSSDNNLDKALKAKMNKLEKRDG